MTVEINMENYYPGYSDTEYTNVRDSSLEFTTTTPLYFRDSGIYLYSSSDGVLNIVSDTTLALSGAVTTDGNVTMTIGASNAFTLTVSDASAPLVMTNTMTTAAKTGARAEFKVIVSAALGGWVNALKGYLDITTTSGSCTGLGSAIIAEMRLPASALALGSYACVEHELVTQASGTVASDMPIAFQWFQVSGNSTATTDWENNGYFAIIKGMTAGNDKIFATVGDVAAAGTLRILIGDTDYYLMIATGTS